MYFLENCLGRVPLVLARSYSVSNEFKDDQKNFHKSDRSLLVEYGRSGASSPRVIRAPVRTKLPAAVHVAKPAALPFGAYVLHAGLILRT